MVLELCTNHTLNEMLKKRKRISELETQYYLQQIVTGLTYVHQQKVIHRE
jgi:polo-like kinase 1